jgi:uncharacterized Rmd1/YagE family protein
MRWAPISMQIRTTILDKINISANSGFSLYGTDSNGNPIGTFEYTQKKKIMRLTNFTTSLDFSLSELLKGNKDKNKTTTPQNPSNQSLFENNALNKPNALPQPNTVPKLIDAYGYPVFNPTWALNISYSLNYFITGLKSILSQTLSFNGNVAITKKMGITYTSGYDFTGKQITMTNIGITRDLHCWVMSFNWVPNGTMKSWNFTIRVKAPVLGDLKYERRKDFFNAY